MSIPEVRTELVAARDAIAAPLEGLRDLLNLDDLQTEAKRALHELRATYERRRVILENAIGACDQLIADGYPVVVDAVLVADAFASVKAQVDSIAAAFAKLHPEPEAVSGSLEFGAPVPK